MKSLKNRKTALSVALLMALAAHPLTSLAKTYTGIHAYEEKTEAGGWIVDITANQTDVEHVYEGSSGAIINTTTTSPGSLPSLTVNIGTDENPVEISKNFTGVFVSSVPSAYHNSFTMEGPLTINVNPGSFVSANLFSFNEGVSGDDANNRFILKAGDINVNITGKDDTNQQEGNVYGYYAEKGTNADSTIGNINITVKDSEELDSLGTSTGGIYGIHYDKTNSTLNTGAVSILVTNGFDGKGTYGFQSELGKGTGSVVTIDSITLTSSNYAGVDGYLRGIEKQGNELLKVTHDVSISGDQITEGRINGVFTRGGTTEIGGNVNVYLHDVKDTHPEEDNLTGIWLARNGSVDVKGNVVVTFMNDSDFSGTFNQNITGVGITKVDRIDTTVTQTQNASVSIGGNVIVQLGGSAESVGLKGHTVYGAVNNGGNNTSIDFTNGGKRYLYFGFEQNDGTKQTFSSLDPQKQYTSFQGSFSNFDSVVVKGGSSLYIGFGQTLGLIGEDDLFATTAISSGNKTTGFSPILHFVDFLNGERYSKNVNEGVINGIVSMGGVISMAKDTSMLIEKDALANFWLLQNEAGAAIQVDGTLELNNTSITATMSTAHAMGSAYNKGDIGGAGKLILTTASPIDNETVQTYNYVGGSRDTVLSANAVTYLNAGKIFVSDLEIGKNFDLQNTGTIAVGELSSDSATINSTGAISATGQMDLVNSQVSTSNQIEAGTLVLTGSTVRASDTSPREDIELDSDINDSFQVIADTMEVKDSSTLETSHSVYVKDSMTVASSTVEAGLEIYAGNMELTSNSAIDSKSIDVNGNMDISASEVKASEQVYAGEMQVSDSSELNAQTIWVKEGMVVTGSAVDATNSVSVGSLQLVDGSTLESQAVQVEGTMTVANSTVDTSKSVSAGNLEVSSLSQLNSQIVAVNESMTVHNSTVNATDSLYAGSMVLNNGSTVESQTIEVGNIKADSSDVKTSDPSTLQVSGNSRLNAQTIAVKDGMTVSASTVDATDLLYAGSLQLVNGSQVETKAARVDGEMTVGNSTVNASNTLQAGSLQLADSSKVDTQAMVVEGDITVDNSAVNASQSLYAGSMQVLEDSQLDSQAVAVKDGMAVSNSTVNATDSLYAGSLQLADSAMVETKALRVEDTMKVANSTVSAQDQLHVGNLQLADSSKVETKALKVEGTMNVANSTVLAQENISAGNLEATSSDIKSQSILANGALAISTSTVEAKLPVGAHGKEETQTTKIPEGLIQASGPITIDSSIVTGSDIVSDKSVAITNSTINATNLFAAPHMLSVSATPLMGSKAQTAGTMQVKHSNLNVADSIFAQGQMAITDGTELNSNQLQAGSLTVSDSTVKASGSIVALGAMDVSNSTINSTQLYVGGNFDLKDSEVVTSESISVGGTLTATGSYIQTTTSVVSGHLHLTDSVLETDDLITATETMKIVNSTVTTTGPINATQASITNASKVIADGDFSARTLNITDGSLYVGERSDGIAVKTDNFSLQKGKVVLNNGTFEASTSATLAGGTFTVGSEYSTAEVQLNPISLKERAVVNLNTAFEISNGSKLALGSTNALTDTKAIFSYLDIDASSKAVLAVNKTIVSGSTGSIDVGYAAGKNHPMLLSLDPESASYATTASSDNSLRFGSDSILAIEINPYSALVNNNQTSVFSTTADNSSIIVDNGATVVLYGDLQPGRYNITKGYDIAEQTINGWDHQNDGEIRVYVEDASGLDWTYERGTSLKKDGSDNDYVWIDVISHEDVQDVYPDLIVPDIANGAFDDCSSGQFICGVLRDDTLTELQKVDIINSASAIAFTGGVMATSMNDLTHGFGAIYNHLTMDSDTFGANGNLWPWKEDNNFWIDVLGNWSRSHNLSATGISKIGYRDSTYGFILGYDHKVANYPVSFGIAFSYQDGNLKSQGDLIKTTNKHQSYGAHFYANYSPNEYLNLIGSVHLLRNSSDLNQQYISRTERVGTATAYTNMVAIGLRAETTIKAGIVNVIPHIEPRYIYGKTQSFDTKVDGNKTWRTRFGGNSLFQIPVGVAFRSDFKTESGWNVRPTLDLSVIPQVGSNRQSMKIKSTTGQSNQIYGEFQGKFAAEAQLGVSFDKGPWTVGAKYGFGGGLKGRYEHGFKVEARLRW